MSFSYQCAHCQSLLTVHPRSPGTRITCPTCRNVVTVPKAPALVSRKPLSGYGTLALLLLGCLTAGLAYSLPPWRQEADTVPVTSQFDLAGRKPGVTSAQNGPVLPTRVAASISETEQPELIEETPPAEKEIGAHVASAVPQAAAVKLAAPMPVPVKEAKVPPAAEELGVKRIRRLTDEDLRKQLFAVPEVNLDRVPSTSAKIVKAAAREAAKHPQARELVHILPTLLPQRSDLHGLPMRMGADCQLGKDSAENLHVLSRKLRLYISSSVPEDDTDPRPDPAHLRKLLDRYNGESREWQHVAAISTLQQMLQAENTPLRLLLIELLSQIKDPAASVALSQRALFDLSPEVRAAAVQALNRRSREDYRDVLLNGFRYPWPAVAEHAAEALVALKDKEAIPDLRKLLNEPAPGTPYFDRKHQMFRVRELVRINHFRNCLLCHAPSTHHADLVRGAVPDPDRPLLSPDSRRSYDANKGIFVRADVTYLRQDFSVPQPVDKPGKWPETQRYDYLVRTRAATMTDQQQRRNQQREDAIRFALANLNKV